MSKKYRYYLNIGSNLGDTTGNIKRAEQELDQAFGLTLRSDTVRSAPWGFESDHEFLNVGVAVDSDLEPPEMLRRLKEIEKALCPSAHRNADGTYRDRETDLDIMTLRNIHEAKDMEWHTPDLTIPHRHLQDRPFFLEPLQELRTQPTVVLKGGRVLVRKAFLGEENSRGNTVEFPQQDSTSGLPQRLSSLPTAEEVAALEAVSPRFRFPRLNGFETLPRAEAPEGFEWMGIRESWQVLGETGWEGVSRIAELLTWDCETRFCGRCGKPMERQTEISKRCPDCGVERFPKLSPAVLVLVTRGEEALLVHGAGMRPKMHALVAGFVETGETLEECCHREVAEETGMEIEGLEYFGSQPWPFPGQLMVGFRCRWKSGQPRWADGELTSGGFMTRQEVRSRERSGEIALPSQPSLSRRLIDAWLNPSPL